MERNDAGSAGGGMKFKLEEHLGAGFILVSRLAAGALRLSPLHLNFNCQYLSNAGKNSQLILIDLAWLDAHPVFRHLQFCQYCVDPSTVNAKKSQQIKSEITDVSDS